VSFYYYLKVLKQCYVVAASQDAPDARVSGFGQLVLLLLAILVILLGCFPDWLVGPLQAGLDAAGH
jgi:NADH:ubiquinone oxidoreductase subunit 2 (subunit N)